MAFRVNTLATVEWRVDQVMASSVAEGEEEAGAQVHLKVAVSGIYVGKLCVAGGWWFLVVSAPLRLCAGPLVFCYPASPQVDTAPHRTDAGAAAEVEETAVVMTAAGCSVFAIGAFVATSTRENPILAVLLLLAQLLLMYAPPANPEKRGIARVLVPP